MIIPQKGQIPSTLSYILLTLFCIPFTIPITDLYVLCIPSLKSPRPLPNMSVWLISCSNLIGLGAWEVIQIWTVWLVSQKICSDRGNSCYILAAAQTKKQLSGAVCPSSDGQKKPELQGNLKRRFWVSYIWKCFFVTNLTDSCDHLSGTVESSSFLSSKYHAIIRKGSSHC